MQEFKKICSIIDLHNFYIKKITEIRLIEFKKSFNR